MVFNVIKAAVVPYLMYETDQIVKVMREIAFRCAHKVYKDVIMSRNNICIAQVGDC